MSRDQITVTFECLDCGGTVLELPDNPTDDSVAVCKTCGRSHGRYGDIKAKGREMALNEARRITDEHFARITKAFSRLGNR
ncbi:ECs_2282 family putative zinc-binding protein [Bauldia litoralis]|uniref:ECs_2282 family putative zinc-binding protein n=1 Tax=Bauldia litoralis TaxID=665467 RepID=UPI003267C3DA